MVFRNFIYKVKAVVKDALPKAIKRITLCFPCQKRVNTKGEKWNCVDLPHSGEKEKKRNWVGLLHNGDEKKRNWVDLPHEGEKEKKRNWIDLPDSGEKMNWVDLPDSVTLRIFCKLETPEIFVAVRHVCSSWRKLAKEPVLYRSVVIGSRVRFINWGKGHFSTLNFHKLIDEVVALSCGQMIQFSCGMMFVTRKHTLQNVAASSVSGLKSLRLGFAERMDAHDLTEVIRSIPSLEELYYTSDIILDSSIEEIGRSCPRLQYFWCKITFSKSEVFAIAKNMPGLRRLCLYGSELTNSGLQAILDGCPHLEYLYVKGWFHTNLEDAEFWKNKQVSGRIKSKRLLSQRCFTEWEFDLKTPLDDGEPCLSKPLPSNMCPTEHVGDYGLYQYTSQFVDLTHTNFHPYNPVMYDSYKQQVYGYTKEDTTL